MIEDFVKQTLAQDVGRGDLYALVEQSIDSSAKIIAKSDGVVAGVTYIDALASLESFKCVWNKKDGESFVSDDVLATLSGDSHTLLKIERTLLNILLHASSIATLTRKYIKILEPYGVKLLDTRKTRPALRELEKYAVRCGGGVNHRLGLDDCLMLKDTHVATIKDLKSFMKKVRKEIPWTSKVEIECENFEQVKRASEAGADIIMCDNMSYEEIKEVVKFRDENYPHILVEASGNVTKENLLEYAKTGVDAISSGSLIHQAVWVDFSMKVVS
jgi:nicotinate-nucleotide pyrophosphorylase (carboxylating)